MVMDLLLLSLQFHYSKKLSRRLQLSGVHSPNEPVEMMLRAAGLFKNLGIEHETRSYADVEIFDLFTGRARTPRLRESADSEVGAQMLQRYFRRCLNRNALDLTMDGRRAMLGLLGEVLDNASLHSGAPVWFVIGYMHQVDDVSKPRGDCSIAIVSPGRTFYDTLNSPGVSGDLTQKLRLLSEQHERKGFFSSGWDREVLWTLYALQEGVTRFRGQGPSGASGRRGIGTIEMLEFFEDLVPEIYQTDTKMCLLSGHTHITFNGKYRLRSVTVEGEDRRVIAFNEANDLNLPPDPACVTKLDARFPGTLLSMRFPIDRDLIQAAGGH